MKYAEIVVNTPLAPLNRRTGDEYGAPAPSLRERAFTYSIPSRLAGSIAVGQLVWVPFGARRLQGVVVAFSESSPVEKTRDIDEIVDPRPYLSPRHIELAHWIARTYLCSLNDAVQLMLPSGVEQEPRLLISLAPETSPGDLNSRQAELVEMLSREGEVDWRMLARPLRA